MRRLVLLGLLAAAPVLADESAVQLKDADGRALVEANCVMCHSLDYIPMNSVFLDRKGWEASVNKMIKVMGAPIPERDVPAVVDYLTDVWDSLSTPELEMGECAAIGAFIRPARLDGRCVYCLTKFAMDRIDPEDHGCIMARHAHAR